MKRRAVRYTDRSKQLRGRLLGQPRPEPRKVEIDGEAFFVKTPTISEREEINKEALGDIDLSDGKGKLNAADIRTDKLTATACVYLACDDTGCPIFEPADLEAIMDAPMGSWVERLAHECLLAIRPKGLEEGKAQGTPPGEDSTSSSPSASDAPSPS